MKKKKGISIIEILLAVAIFIIGVATITLMYINSLIGSVNSLEETGAIFLAQEGLEAVKSIRNVNFDNLSMGNYELALAETGWKLISTKGLVGHWQLNGDAKDSSGFENHGTIYGAIPVEDRKGTVSAALSFDGVDDYVKISKNVISDDITLTIWIYPKVISDGYYHGFAGYQGASVYYRPFNLWVSPNAGLHWWISKSDNSQYHAGAISNFFESTNKWYFIAFRKSGTKLTVFKNDVRYDLPDSPFTDLYKPSEYWIGRVDNYFNGFIDDVRIYSRALSDSEIKNLFNLYDGKYKREVSLSGNISEGLVGYWKFDEGTGMIAHDSSGNGNDGSLKPDESGPMWTEGKLGSALRFDGVNDYVNILDPGIPNWPLDITEQITISAWIKPQTPFRDFFSKTNWNMWRIILNESGVNNVKIVQDIGGSNVTTLSANNVISADQWIHVAYTYNGSQTQIYINGEPSGPSVPASGLLATNDNPITIGYWPNSPDRYYKGLIDEVRIYNRALSREEVQKIYLQELYNLNEELRNFTVKAKVVWQDPVLKKERKVELVEMIGDIY